MSLLNIILEQGRGNVGGTGRGDVQSGGGPSLASTGFKTTGEGNDFRKWFRGKYPSKATEFKLDETGEFDNNYIRKAYNYKPENSNKTAGELYKESKPSGGESGGNVPSQSTPLDSRGYNPDVVKFAKEIIFFDDAGRSIKKFDASLNEDFDNDGEVNRALKVATNLVPNRKMTPYRAYIFAVNYVLLERGVNIGSIEVPKEYQKDLPQGTIIENLVLKPLVGLINLLTEQDRVRISINTDDGTKKIGTVVKTRKTNVGFTCNLQNPLKFDANFPDEDPLIGMVKDKLNVGQGEDELQKNIFTAGLASAIIQYRTEKGLAYSRNKGYIDTELVRELFSERCKPMAGSTPSGTSSDSGVQGFSLRNFGFREVLERANSILSEASSNVDLYFKDCQYIFDEYPKVARSADSTITALPQSRKPDRNKISDSSELKNIKEAITYCATKRKGKTKVSMVVDKLNVFKRGIKSIMDLPSPWRMSEFEIFKGSQIGSENN